MTLAQRARDELGALAIRASLAGRFDARTVVALTSSPRSGSTWLGNLLRSIPDSCLLFEPLHLAQVPEAKAAGFSWRTYVPPEADWPEGEAFLRRVFAGRVVNRWTTREMTLREARRSRWMIVKFVRANRLLPWLCRTFPLRAAVLLIRHPCAVVASQLRFPEWQHAPRPQAPGYLDQRPALREALARTRGVEEHLAAAWALDQLPPLWDAPPRRWVLVTYEELVRRPEAALERIGKAGGLPLDVEAVLARVASPSSMVHESGVSGLDGWRRQLSDEQASRILATVRAFGLDFYGRELEPDYGALEKGVNAALPG